MNYKVLIVDDSKLARMAVTKTLKTLHPDWVATEAGSADDALISIEREAPDVVVLDFNMPGRDGLELAGEIRKLKPRMPVAVISANHQQEVVKRAHDAGAMFLPKPLTDAAFAKFLDAAVQRLKAPKS